MAVILFVILAGNSDGSSYAAEPLVLENDRISAEIDRQTGSLRSVRDKDQGIPYEMSGIGFEVATATGSIRAEKAVEARSTKDKVTLRFSGSGLDVTLHYQLGPDHHFIEKWLEIKASDGKPLLSQVGPLGGHENRRVF